MKPKTVEATHMKAVSISAPVRTLSKEGKKVRTSDLPGPVLGSYKDLRFCCFDTKVHGKTM